MEETILPRGYVLEKMKRGTLRLYRIRREEKQHIVASADCYPAEYRGERHYWLRDLKVHPDHRHQGLGRYLISMIRQDCGGFPIRSVIDPGVEEPLLSFEELRLFYQRCGACVAENTLYWPALSAPVNFCADLGKTENSN